MLNFVLHRRLKTATRQQLNFGKKKSLGSAIKNLKSCLKIDAVVKENEGNNAQQYYC